MSVTVFVFNLKTSLRHSLEKPTMIYCFIEEDTNTMPTDTHVKCT